MCRGKGRCAQLAFCEPLVNTVPKNFSTSAARLNSRMPSSRAAITVSKILVANKIHASAQQAQIEIGALQNDLLLRQRLGERGQVETRQRIDQVIVAAKTKLHETKLFVITVQTVGLGIDRDAIDPLQLREQLCELGISGDHLNPLRSSSALVLVA